VSGIYYALSIVAIFVVIRWFIANDKAKPDEPTQGLLAMRDTKTTAVSTPDPGTTQEDARRKP
jgi:hypothetical protein